MSLNKPSVVRLIEPTLEEKAPPGEPEYEIVEAVEAKTREKRHA